MKKNAACQVSRRAFRLNGRDVFLYSGEVHYFRIPRRYWARHLQALVDARAVAVSTYVPWSWHEPREGFVDFTGRTHPERDLVGFLDLARDLGLFVTLKPGPYIMAETTDGGIPRWFTRQHPEACYMDENGHHWHPECVTFASPVFREKAAAWLKRFAREIVLPRQTAPRGAVILLQLCNEIGIFQWLSARGDYSYANVAAWHHYLRAEFGDVKRLARFLELDVSDFTEVPPPRGDCTSRADFRHYRLWHDFHRWLYADYVAWLVKTLRECGVKVPFFTNIGGWVFGRAHEYPLNATFHRRTAEVAPEVLYGIDHIPEFVSPLNLHDGPIANQVTDELQRGRKPLYSAELQCGSREHGVEPYPSELALFYRHNLIHGLTGMNFYMFSQGRNPRGRGVDGPMFYWYTALDYRGRRQETYPVIQELGQWLAFNGRFLVRSEKPAALAVGFYPPLYETEFFFPKLQKDARMNPAALGLMDWVGFRDRAYFDGVLRILHKKNVPHELADLTVRSVAHLLRYRALVVLSVETMDAATQAKLAEFVRRGGNLVIFPRLPQYGLDLAPCTVLQDALGISPGPAAASNRVDLGDLRDIPVAGPVVTLKARNARILARNAAGEIVGLERKIGRGVARVFGFQVHYTIEEHPRLWSVMMNLDGMPRNAWTDNDVLTVEARYAGDQGLLFVGNFHRASRRSRIAVRVPGAKTPLDLGPLELEPLTGLLLPLNVRLRGNLTLLCAHAELLGMRRSAHGVRLVLRGPAKLPGRILLRAPITLSEVRLDGESVAFKRREGRVEIAYRQTGEPQTVELILAR